MKNLWILVLAMFAVSLVVVVAGCPQPSPAITPPDASDAATQITVTVTVSDSGHVTITPCNLACTNMAKIGCPEGTNANCVDVCNHAQASGLTNLKPDCLASATTPAAAKACGTVTCAIDAGVKK